MKILHVIAGLNENGGGTSEVVPRMCEELVRNGHEVTLLTVEYGNLSVAAERAAMHGVELVVCRESKGLPRALSHSFEMARRMKHFVSNADILHLHCLWQWPCWRAANEAIRMGKPYVMQTHGFLEAERLKKSRLKKAIVGHLIERPRLDRAKEIIATAESEKNGLLRYGITSPIKIVPIGIDTTEIDEVERDEEFMYRLGVPRGKKVLLYLSRLAPIKGLDLLADAWIKLADLHKDWHLLIVGDDLQGYSEIIKREYANKIMDGSVTFPGPVFGSKKISLLKSADAFVLPTRNENFSIAVQEALAAGLPTVCTKGAPWQMIENEHAGKWVDVTVQAICDGLRSVLTADREVQRAMGLAGKRIVARYFGWASIEKKLEGVYVDALRSSK